MTSSISYSSTVQGGTPDGSGGDAALATLSAIVRAIASGDVRRYLRRLHAGAGEVRL